MSESDAAFVLEAIDNHWAYRLRSKKGFSFWLVRDTRRLPENEVGFSVDEFTELSKLDDPWPAIEVKLGLAGAKLTTVTRIETTKPKPKQEKLW